MNNYPFKPSYRVAVVGMGAVTPIGIGVEDFWQGLLEGRTAARKLDFLDERVGCQVGGLVRDFDEKSFRLEVAEEVHTDRKKTVFSVLRRTERANLLGLAAVRQAVKQCSLPEELFENTALMIGSNIAATDKVIEAIEQYRKNPGSVNFNLAMQGMPNATTAVVSIVYQFLGGSFAPASACATGSHSIGQAFIAIATGQCPVVVAGGCESNFTPHLVASFDNLRALTHHNEEPEKASRPFDAKRDGFVPSEGAGALVLMNAELAKELGIPILAEVIGYGMSNDGEHMVLPSVYGQKLSMTRALTMAEIVDGTSRHDVDHLNAHATSTPEGDGKELEAAQEVLEEHAGEVSVTAVKGATGHTFGGAGAIEGVASIKTIQTGLIPATHGLESPNDETDLRHVIGSPIEEDVQVVLKNSFGFGGTNTTIVYKRWQD